MKLIWILAICMSVSVSAVGQLVAIMQVDEPIEGVCDQQKVYMLLPFEGQVEAKCPMSKDEILARLNSEVAYLQENPKFKGKGMINLIINCEGKVVSCRMDNKTKSKELDGQIEAVFASLGEWKAGTMYEKKVDSSVLFSFKIKKGVFYWD